MNHHCCEPQPDSAPRKRKFDPFLMGIVAITLLFLGAVIYFGTRVGATAQVNANDQVTMTVAENSYDWGTIDINGGIVSKSFIIENKGSVPLKLYDIKTSCMCTTAQLKTAKQVSKKFGMHEKTSSVFEVQPGEMAELIVEFDPAFHGPSGVGPISRTITVNTNDSSNPALSFHLTANVVKN